MEQPDLTTPVDMVNELRNKVFDLSLSEDDFARMVDRVAAVLALDIQG